MRGRCPLIGQRHGEVADAAPDLPGVDGSETQLQSIRCQRSRAVTAQRRDLHIAPQGIQVVRANCGDHVCVTLFSPSLWFCGTWFKAAVEQHLTDLANAKVDQRVARVAVDAVQNLLEKLTAEPFAANLQAFQLGADKEGK
jgi:hypothetical protein